MSFGDLISSGRGPGVIGMIMAALVLAGFGAIYVFVFDAEMQGRGVSIESVVRQQAEEIDDYNHQITMNKKFIEETSETEAKNAKIDALEKANLAEANKPAQLKEEIIKLKEAIVSSTKAMNAYITDYRNHVRTKAVGEKLAEIKLKTGEVYTNVEVREVSEIGIQIRHTDGQKRIAYEELSAEWQERFQFDPDEKAKALARELAAQQLYERSVETSVEETGDPAKIDTSTPQGMTQADGVLRTKNVEMARLKRELGRLQAEAGTAETKDSLDRPKGNADLGRIRDLRTRMQAVESQIYKLAREIADLKTKIAR